MTLAARSYTHDECDSTLISDAVTAGRQPARAPAVRLEGRCIAGRYLVRELIGEGGFGRVYRAETIDSTQSVAIKVIGPLGSADRDLVRQFHAEVAAARRVRHRNVVTTFDHGQTEDGLLYLVMEYVPGRTLGSVLEQAGALPLDRAVDVAVQILDALAATHAAGVVHADLKSANIMIRDLGARVQVKLIDFSIARLVHDSEHSAAVWGRGHRIAGTPQYMAPEVVTGSAPTRAADLYAVGVLLHRMVTGALPFSGDNSLEIMMQHLDEPVARPSERFADLAIPAQLEDIILRALAKDPGQRFADAAEFIEALESVRRCARPAEPDPCRVTARALRLPVATRVIQCASNAPRPRTRIRAQPMAPVDHCCVPAAVHARVHACRAADADSPAPDPAVAGPAHRGSLARAPEPRDPTLLDPRRRARPALRQLSDLPLQ